jgi:sugar lactone lactonase YvrE
MAYAVDWTITPSRPLGVVQAADQPSPQLGGVCVTSKGALVVTEPGADRVRWTSADGSSFVIGGTPGWMDGRRAAARFRRPLAVAAGLDGSVVVADTDNHAIRRVSPHGDVATLAGGIYGAADGPGGQARFRHPHGVAVAPDGSIVVADTVNDTIRVIDPDGQVTTLAGSSYGYGDIEAGGALFRRPEGVAVGTDGTVYVADTGNDRVCALDASGRSRLVAGRQRPSLPRAAAPDLRWPTSLAIAPDGTIYVTDAVHSLVYRIGPDGTATVLPREQGWRPVALTLAPNGELLVAEAHWSPQRTIGRLRTIAQAGTPASPRVARQEALAR